MAANRGPTTGINKSIVPNFINVAITIMIIQFYHYMKNIDALGKLSL
jgi:hypothetical protein